MRSWFRELLGRRSWRMNVLMVFCAYLAFVYVPWDFFCKPLARDAEVWFGITLHGWAAKATEPLHWAIYMAGVYGFWRMRAWMWPWAALYAAQVALGRQPSVISGWFNWLRANTPRLAPRSLTALIAGEVMAKWTPPEMR